MDFEYGTVTMQNIKEVTDRLRKLLVGCKYTVVHCYEYRDYKPKIRLHQELGGSANGDDVNLHFHSDSHALVTIYDTYGVNQFSTSQVESGHDPEFKAPHVIFERGKFWITHRAPNGKLIQSVYAPE